jgi:hypothetical protein
MEQGGRPLTAAKRRSPILAIAAGLIFGTVLVSALTAWQHGAAASNTSQAVTSSPEGAAQAVPDNIRMDVSSNIRMD